VLGWASRKRGEGEGGRTLEGHQSQFPGNIIEVLERYAAAATVAAEAEASGGQKIVWAYVVFDGPGVRSHSPPTVCIRATRLV
jgi:hypothetical protein